MLPASKINISDSEIADFYNRDKAQFNLIEPLWHLAQILVTTTNNTGKSLTLGNGRAVLLELKKSTELANDFD